ncbi:MAG: hypothetical protein HY059_12045 [Proteobacteria bacterium]|nr:hypothetical protein [Pseudomonadota bacterium]
MSSAGPKGVIARDLEAVDLFAQIARGDYCVQYKIVFGEEPATRAACKPAIEEFARRKELEDATASARLARAYGEFASLSSEEKTSRRNEIQDEIFRASEQRCNAFKTYLQRLQSNTGFFGNSLATVLGGLGAIFTDAGVARSLAGAAGITTGVTSQFNESYFFSLTVPIISDGIDNARSTVHAQSMERRTKPDPADASKKIPATAFDYTLQAAILDAVRYDGACSIPEGLRAAGEATRSLRTPGPDILAKAIDQYNAVRDKLRAERPAAAPAPAAPAAAPAPAASVDRIDLPALVPAR